MIDRESTRESTKAAAALEAYLALGPDRSLRKLAESNQKYSKSVALLMRWSKQHQWQQRAREYDEQQRAEQRRQHEAALKEMNELHWRTARQQYLKSHERIMQLLDNHKLSLYALSQINKNAFDNERSARGVDEMQLDLEELLEREKERKGNSN